MSKAIKRGDFTEVSPTIYLQSLFETSTEQKHRLGTLRRLSDGRVFVYAKAGANLSPGTLCQSPAMVSNHRNLAVANATAGSKKVTVTLGATAVAANRYAEGYLSINTGSVGVGQYYKVLSHGAANANASLDVNLNDKLRTNLASASDKATLVPNIYNGVTATTIPAGTAVVGVTPIPVAANEYFWLQKGGIATVLCSGTIVAGRRCIADGANGAVAPVPSNATDAVQRHIVGKVVDVAANGHYAMVDLEL